MFDRAKAVIAFVCAAAGSSGAAAADPANLFDPYFPIQADSFVELSSASAPVGDAGEIIRQAIGQAASVNSAAARWHAAEQGAEAAELDYLDNSSLYVESALSSDGATRYTYGVRVSLPLYDGGARTFRTRSSQRSADAAANEANDELAATIVDLASALASLQLAWSIGTIYERQQNDLLALRDQVQAEIAVGTASRVDLSLVDIQIQQLAISVIGAKLNAQQARKAFYGIAGMYPARFDRMASIASALPTSEDMAIDMAFRNNAKLSASTNNAMAADAYADSIHAGAGAKLDLNLDFGGTSDTLISGLEPVGRVSLRLSVPLDAGSGARVFQARYEAQAAGLAVDAARIGVAAGVGSLFEALAAARDRRTLAERAVQSAQDALYGILQESKLGERGVSDRISATSRLAETRVAAAEAAYQVGVTEHLLAAQLGILPDIYGIRLQ